jgi:chromosome condensin MukBEF MukE localization factor
MISHPDRVELYGNGKLLVALDSSIVPAVGSFVSIRGETWKVDRVTYAVDYADKMMERYMRANVEMKKAKK